MDSYEITNEMTDKEILVTMKTNVKEISNEENIKLMKMTNDRKYSNSFWLYWKNTNEWPIVENPVVKSHY